jgi:hypothetical protein
MTKNVENIENDLLGAYAAHPIKIALVFSWYCLEVSISMIGLKRKRKESPRAISPLLSVV